MSSEAAALDALIHELLVLAAEARQRGDFADASDEALAPAYWYGVSDGIEAAIERLRALRPGDQT